MKNKCARILVVLPLLGFMLLSFQNFSGSSSSQIYFSSSGLKLSKDNIFTLEPGVGIPTGLNAILWQKNYPVGKGKIPAVAMLGTPVGWNIGTYSGFQPTSSTELMQLGYPGSQQGQTAVQVQGDTIGVVLESQSMMNPNGSWPAGPMPLMVQYSTNQAIYPFNQTSRVLTLSMDLQVPYSKTSFNTSSNQIVLYLSFIDKVSRHSIAYGAQVWDSRGLGGEGSMVSVDAATRSIMVLAPISSGDEYITAVSDSSKFQLKTWTGFKHFVFAISEANMQNAIAAINRSYPNAVSTDISNYYVNGFSVDSEIEYQNSPASFAYAVKNLELASEPENSMSEKPAPIKTLIQDIKQDL